MTEQQFLEYFPFLFPFLFVGMWLSVSGALWLLSGWSNLQETFPDRNEVADVKVRGQSGAIGQSLMIYRHVTYGNCLNFDVCRSGLRVSLTWMFRGLWSKPFFVPWHQVEVEDVKLLFFAWKRLSFRGFGGSSVFVRPRTFEKIRAGSNGKLADTALGYRS